MIEVGDHFVYRSKYGGITEGIIGAIQKIKVINIELGYVVWKITIKSTNNVFYDVEEVTFVEHKLSGEEIQRWKELSANVTKSKAKRKAEFDELVKKYTNESSKKGS